MDNLSKALALARIGLKNFPVHVSNRQPAISLADGGKGFYDGTLDIEQLATWFGEEFADRSKYAVAVWAGGSGVVVPDLDRGKKNGKDGFDSLTMAGLAVSPTFHYKTSSGGEHHIYATDDEALTLARDAEVGGVKLEGVDIRAGGSYFVWWGNEVPASRDAFSKDIPAWVIEGATAKNTFSGEGFEGSIKEWLDTIPDNVLPSHKITEVMNRIPTGDFGHPEMIELAWEIVRLGAERETGVRRALDKLASEWLRDPYNTPENRKDLFTAIQGAISKGGRVQRPVPTRMRASIAMQRAGDLGILDELKSINRAVSGNDDEADLSRTRREMFKIIADAGMSPSAAIGIVTSTKAYEISKAGVESVWFGEGEPLFHDTQDEEPIDPEEGPEDEDVRVKHMLARWADDSQAFSLLTEDEQALLATPPYRWWGDEYLEWVEGQIKHFNRPYHVGMMWAALSTITSTWGKLPIAGEDDTDVNLYIAPVGASSTGKTEAVNFGTHLIDETFSSESNPIIGDISKLSAIGLHQSLIHRDGEPSMIFGDEIQSFFQGVKNTQWQNGIMGDISSHYGGRVSPKLMLNDKSISGKRARTMFTVYLTGIADQLLDAVTLEQWTSGFFYRFLWSFGNPRDAEDDEIMMRSAATTPSGQMAVWAREFKRLGPQQAMKWGVGRSVEWEPDALKRMVQMRTAIRKATEKLPLHDSVYINANGRFYISVMKCATIIALVEAEEKVTLRHVLIALQYAGPWHRSMVIAVEETAKDPFEREVDRAMDWIRANALKQSGVKPRIQRAEVMRRFKPNEVANRLLTQLVEEGRLIKHGDVYEVQPDE